MSTCPDCGEFIGLSRRLDSGDQNKCDSCGAAIEQLASADYLTLFPCPECGTGRLDVVAMMTDMEPRVRCLDCGFDITDATLEYCRHPDGSSHDESCSGLNAAITLELNGLLHSHRRVGLELVKAVIAKREYSRKCIELNRVIAEERERAAAAESRNAELENKFESLRSLIAREFAK